MNEINYKKELEHYQEEIRTKLIDIQSRMVALNDDILRLSILVQSGRFYNCMKALTNDTTKQHKFKQIKELVVVLKNIYPLVAIEGNDSEKVIDKILKIIDEVDNDR